MTGNLTFNQKNVIAKSGFSISQGVSSNTAGSGIYVRDSAGNDVGNLVGYLYADGRQGIRVGCENNFAYITHIDTTPYVYLNAPDAWRTALGVNITQTSDISSSTVSVANDTFTSLTSFTCPAKPCIIECVATLAANSLGARTLLISSSEDSSSPLNRYAIIKMSPSQSGTTTMQFTSIQNESTARTLYLRFWQNSGSALTVNSWGVRILEFY